MKHESQCPISIFRTKIVKLSTYSASTAVSHANPRVPAVFAGLLAVAMVLGTNRPVQAAGECIAQPDQRVHQDGHWYYHSDRVHHRRCWYFDSSEVTISPSSSPSLPGRGLSPNADSQPSWFSQFAAGLTQTLSSGPQQNSA